MSGPLIGRPETSGAPILIVDDDAAVRELLASHLGREGFEIREAATGEAALRMVDAEAVSLVILDMQMPGLSGMEVIRALRARPGMATLTIMVLTGQGDVYPLATSLGVGADDYLTKPIELDELVARVRARLRTRHVGAEEARRENEALYRTLVEHSADGILVSDQTGRCVEANEAICRMLGYSRDELLAMFTPSLIAADDPLSPDDIDERLAEPLGGEALLVERRYRRKDGVSLAVEVGFSQLPDKRLQRNVRDITPRLAAEAERWRLASALEQTADAVWMKDVDGKTVTYVNRAFCELYGYEPDEIVGHHASILHSGRHEHSYFDAIWATVASGKTWKGSLFNRRKDGATIEVDAVICGIRDPSGCLLTIMQTERDVTRERELEHELARRARERQMIETSLGRIDPASTPEAIAAGACAGLVGLPNVDSAMVFALDHGVHGSVLAIDGIAARSYSTSLEIPEARVRYLWDRALSGSWNEDWRVRTEDGAYGDQISMTGLRTVAYEPLLGPRGVIGIVGIGIHDDSRDAFIEQLPVLATLASVLGTLLTPGLEARYRDKDLQSGVQAILDAGAFTPFFQPIADIRSGAVAGYEALSRFTDGTAPDTVFGLADRSGLGMALEMATIRAALGAATVLPVGAYLSLNASPALIGSGELETIFRGSDRAIVLEITEHVAIDDYPAIRDELARLGPTVRLTVDDAGAGYASLRHILELAPDFVKLDIGLIRHIEADPARQALVAGMGYFAVKRKIRLIAEGIETVAELETLRTLGVYYGQGYLLGRPQDGRGPGPWPSSITIGGGQTDGRRDQSPPRTPTLLPRIARPRSGRGPRCAERRADGPRGERERP